MSIIESEVALDEKKTCKQENVETSKTSSSKIRKKTKVRLKQVEGKHNGAGTSAVARVQCPICKKHISERRNLNRHLRTIHQIEPKIRPPKLKCCFDNLCEFVCATTSHLREHLKKQHNFGVEERKLSFESRADFETWKEQEEINTCASYVMDTGAKFRNKGKVNYFRCHRSGQIRAEAKCNSGERKRSRPTRGYTQCGITCPSSLQVTENINGSVDVIYYPSHLGHSLNAESVKYMKLSTDEKREIAAKLAQGESIGKIVTEARKKKGKRLSRIHMLQRRDVYNIKSKVNYLEKELDHDWKMLEAWILRMNFDDSSRSPIAYYKSLDESNDYNLVMIHPVQKIIFSLAFDGGIIYVKTKRGKPNLDFNLTALFGVTENGDGYPIAFCISHKTDYSTILTFIQQVADHFGTISTQIFISENVAHYYLAWRNVMAECENKFICTFDLELTWEQKFTELNCPVEKQETICKTLKTLLNERDTDTFETNLVEALNKWNEDNDLKLFVKYFYKFYGRKPCEWASCYRIHSMRNECLNTYLKPLNDLLESIYQEGLRSMDVMMNSLFAIIRNTCLEYLLKYDEDTLTEKIQEIEACHMRSSELSKMTLVNDRGPNAWSVSVDNEVFVVTRDDIECENTCSIACSHCDICVHDYSCSCKDFVIHFNICVHIHIVALTRDVKMELEDETLPMEGDSSALSALKFSAVSMAKSLATHLEESSLTEEEYVHIIMTINKLISR